MPAHLTRALLIDNNQEEKGEMMQGKALTPQTLLSSGLFLFPERAENQQGSQRDQQNLRETDES